MLLRFGDIQDQSMKWSKIDRNFACFWPPIFFGGAPPEFLKSIYKIRPETAIGSSTFYITFAHDCELPTDVDEILRSWGMD